MYTHVFFFLSVWQRICGMIDAFLTFFYFSVFCFLFFFSRFFLCLAARGPVRCVSDVSAVRGRRQVPGVRRHGRRPLPLRARQLPSPGRGFFFFLFLFFLTWSPTSFHYANFLEEEEVEVEVEVEEEEEEEELFIFTG